jgi:hypothetical protein
METTEKPPRELETSPALAVVERLMGLLDQPTEVRVRALVRLCRELSQQYHQEVREAYFAHSWWRLFNQAGINLREALDQAKTEGYPGLSDQELEQAYFVLIHVAYFFEPGGIVEALWPLLPAEPGSQLDSSPTNGALGVVFAAPLPVPAGVRLQQQIRRCFQRLGHLLGRSTTRDWGESELLARAGQCLPSLEADLYEPASPGNKEAL